MKGRLFAFAGGLLASALIVSGCGHHGDRMERYSGKIVKHLASKLELDEAQKGKLEAIRQTLLEKHKEMKSKRGEQLADVLALVRSEKLDKAKVNSLIDQAHKAREEARGKLVDQVADFHASLRPEQKEKLAKLLEDKAKCYMDVQPKK